VDLQKDGESSLDGQEDEIFHMVLVDGKILALYFVTVTVASGLVANGNEKQLLSHLIVDLCYAE